MRQLGCGGVSEVRGAGVMWGCMLVDRRIGWCWCRVIVLGRLRVDSGIGYWLRGGGLVLGSAAAVVGSSFRGPAHTTWNRPFCSFALQSAGADSINMTKSGRIFLGGWCARLRMRLMRFARVGWSSCMMGCANIWGVYLKPFSHVVNSAVRRY